MSTYDDEKPEDQLEFELVLEEDIKCTNCSKYSVGYCTIDGEAVKPEDWCGCFEMAEDDVDWWYFNGQDE